MDVGWTPSQPSNWTNDTTDQNIIENVVVQGSFCALYTIIFAFGVFGNALVCRVVFKNKSMHTATNLFIANLAVSDIMLCFLAVPFTPLYTFLGKWIFGRMLCHVVPYAQGCSVYVSTITLTFIALDRLSVISYPFRIKMKPNSCLKIVACIWIFSLIICAPYGYFMELQDGLLCEEKWPSTEFKRIFGTFTSITQFVFPFVIIAFCYVRISSIINCRSKMEQNFNSRKEEIDRDRNRRTNQKLVAMVAIFGVSWLPLNLFNMFYDYGVMTEEWSYFLISFFGVHGLAMSSTCYNPFLYAWLNENFRRGFEQILPRFRPTTTRSVTNAS